MSDTVPAEAYRLLEAVEKAMKPPDEFTSPRAHPDLDDEHLQPLAARRDATREATLRRIRGEDA